MAQERELLGRSFHIDTTTLTPHGDYLKAEKLAETAKQMPPEYTDRLHDVPLLKLGYSKAY